MPTYSFNCKECGHSWEETRRMSQAHDESPCPSCSCLADHKVIDAPAFKVEGASSSFGYRLGKNMEKARQIRSDHENKFGKYEEFVGKRPGDGTARQIDPDSITFHGDVTKDAVDSVKTGKELT